MPNYGINHSFNTGPWHYCARCGTKTKLETELKWQYGKLLCNDCFDQYPVLVGDIDIKIANELSAIEAHPDMLPSPKLTDPDIQQGEDADVYY